MLPLHAHVLTRHIHIAFVTEQISVFVCAIADLFVACVAIMVVYLIVSAVDNSGASVAVVILVIIYVLTNELMTAFVTMSIVVVIVAPNGYPYSAPITYVIPIIVGMVGVIGIFLAFGFLAADIASCVFIIIDVIKAC